VAVDVSGSVGPFWGNDDGDLLYARGTGAGQELVRRGLGQFPEKLFEAGVGVPSSSEVWAAFHGGAINGRGDAAFVASTTLEDDPYTPADESLEPARRAAWAFRGNTLFRIGRYGSPSPFPDLFGGRVPWAAFFDAAPLGRGDGGPASVVFSAQVGGNDGRQGIFRWDETTGTVTPLVLTGDFSPAGGPYTTFGRVRVNEAGDLLFYALTQVSPTAPIAPGLFRIDTLGNVARIVKFGVEGDAVPGVGRFSLMQDFDVEGSGDVVFASAVTSGPAAPSGLFRWRSGTVSAVVTEGDTTPLGGTFGPFTQSQVRCDEAGNAVFLVPLSADVGGVGLFSAPAGSPDLLPLGTTTEPLTLASLGGGRIAYQTPDETRTVLPADGTAEGPTDFRVALVDLRNSTRIASDAVALDVRFRLPPWGAAAPAVFSADAERFTPSATLTGTQLARIAEVRVQVSRVQGGPVLVFGLSGAGKGTVTLNGTAGTVSRVKVSPEGDSATWSFRASNGSGTFTVDLTAGTARLRLAGASLTPNTDPNRFPVALTLRTDADVAAARTDSAAYFHRSVLLDADQPPYGTGRRVLSRGERLPGGTLFLDEVRVTRKLKPVKGQAAPQVTSDSVALAGTLRLAPGSTPPSTPTLAATVRVGSTVFADLPLKRVGSTGSRYAGKLVTGATVLTFTFDVRRASFAFTARNLPPLANLPDADFSGAGGPNDSRNTVGGITLPVSVRMERTYEAASDVAVTRLAGGRVFTR
jgi:hypothetical protein